jgi:hypothetical protein
MRIVGGRGQNVISHKKIFFAHSALRLPELVGVGDKKEEEAGTFSP